jgi:tripartite-type tricarboxylate transporter receptor subunit TctC
MSYAGSAPMMTALQEGKVDYFFDLPTTVEPAIQAGRATPLGVTSLTRWPGLPELKTFHEQGFRGFDLTSWFGLMAPAGLPPDRVKALSDKMAVALKDPDVAKGLQKAGFVVQVLGPQKLEEKIVLDGRSLAKTIKDAGITPVAAR